jgi:hypothetical protein
MVKPAAVAQDTFTMGRPWHHLAICQLALVAQPPICVVLPQAVTVNLRSRKRWPPIRTAAIWILL